MLKNKIFSNEEIVELLKTHYEIEVKSLKNLAGDVDINTFVETTDKQKYIFKISHENEIFENLDFQSQLLAYLNEKSTDLVLPETIFTVRNENILKINNRYLRLLTWVDGRLYSSVYPKTESLRTSLGRTCGKMLKSLIGFNHNYASREFHWDIAQWEWTKEHLGLFNKNEKETIQFFYPKFEAIKSDYLSFRKSVIHNDANDNNVLVNTDYKNPEVISVIDYGDAILSQSINDIAVTSAYALMGLENPNSALISIVTAYHSEFSLEEKEIEAIYTLIALRLIISLTKSAINKSENPENAYLQISVKAAWELLNKWKDIPEAFVTYSLKAACGFEILPIQNDIETWFKSNSVSLKTLIPEFKFKQISSIDMGIDSKFLGNYSEYQDLDLSIEKINNLKRKNPDTLFIGGYLEFRPFYNTETFLIKRNNGKEYRTAHLGIDIWLDSDTAIHSPYDGHVYAISDNSAKGDYGPTVIVEHEISELNRFYILYGHLKKEVIKRLSVGDRIKKNDCIAYIGNESENGEWVPHLHFQLILDPMDFKTDFPGVSAPSELSVWSSLSPDPNILFIEKIPTTEAFSEEKILEYRIEHLGKSLSLSYKKPLSILRGEMQYLIDSKGQKYLDTVNNVAHVGHENPRVVSTAQKEIAILNTNSRYLNKNMIDYTQLLLSTFPKELSVLHFVNSGSEANELAMRMASVHTGQKDMVALEHGYHGNTSGCINVSSYKFDGKGGKGAPEHTHIVPIPDSLRGIYQGKGSGRQYAEHVLEQIKSIKKSDRNIAAFISEVIVSCGGQIELPKDFLKFSYQYVREAGGLCIADEVQHGFGRVGKSFWAFQMHDVVPDIVTMGKPIGNGHPMAAVVCKQEIAESFANGMEFFNTFGGNPVSMAIGKEVLTTIKDEELQEHANELGNYFKNELEKIKKENTIIADVRGQGFFLGVEFLDENQKPLAEKVDYLINQMKERKILLSSDGPDHNVIKIKPPMCFNKSNADEFLNNFNDILNHDFMKN